MSFTTNIHGGGAPVTTESVYYTGTSTLSEGYVLCFDFNAYDKNQEDVAQTSPNVGEELWADARRILVEKCTEQNKLHFAGVVAAESDGITGPGWVTIHRPGSICNVYTYSDVDSENPASGTEGAGTAKGQLVNLVVGQWYMKAFGFPGTGAALVLQDVDRSSTAGLVMAELMTGAPSGGINICSGIASIMNATALTTGATFSNMLGYVPACAGVYILTDGTMGTNAILSVVIEDADAGYMGQKVGIFNSTLVSDVVSIQISGLARTMATHINGAGTIAVTSCYLDLSAAGEYVVLEWNGLHWVQITGHELVVS